MNRSYLFVAVVGLSSCQSNDPPFVQAIDIDTLVPASIAGVIDEPYEFALQSFLECEPRTNVDCQLAYRATRDALLRSAYIYPDRYKELHLIPAEIDKETIANAIRLNDADNTNWLKSVVLKDGWIFRESFGPQAEEFAYLLIQHADADPEFQRVVLSRIEPLAIGGATDRSKFAFLSDRVAIASGELQRFGTQGRCLSPGIWAAYPTNGPEGLAELRAAYGLINLESYSASMAKYC